MVTTLVSFVELKNWGFSTGGVIETTAIIGIVAIKFLSISTVNYARKEYVKKG